jgi:hypothetical protein
MVEVSDRRKVGVKTCLFAICAVLACSAASAEAPRRVDESGLICDPERVFCIRGAIWYRPNSRRLELSGRVTAATGPGWVSIVFRGTTRGNRPASAIMEFPVRGAYSEIVDRAFIPDPPDAQYWRLERLFFEPDEAAADAARDDN